MRLVKLLTLCLTIGAIAAPAMAQPDRPDRPARGERVERGQRLARLAPEDAKAAWTLEAKGFAAGLGLSEEQTAGVIKAYVAARESHVKKAEALAEEFRERRRSGEGRGGAGAEEGDEGGRGAGRGQRRGDGRGEGRGMGGAMAAEREQLIEGSRKALKTSLGEILTEGQLKKAAVSLGTFDVGWDRMVHAIGGMDLGQEKTEQALQAIQGYVTTRGKLRGSGDQEGLREAMRDAREGFDEKMAAILDEEQLRAFRRASGARGGRGGVGGPGGRGGRGGPGLAARLERLDTNGDGKIDRSEVSERMMPLFDRLDANGDGVIDKEEIEAAEQEMGDRGRRGGRGGGGGPGSGSGGGGGGGGGGPF